MLASLIILFLAAVIGLAVPFSHNRQRGWVFSLVPASLFIYYLLRVGNTGNGASPQVSYSWIPELGINLSLQLDGLSMLFALMILGIGTFIFLYAGDYMKDYPHTRRFYFFMLFFTASMLGLVLSTNLLFMFLFWELTSVASFFLIGFFHDKMASRKAAIQAFLITGIGGLALLAGILLLRQVTGSFELDVILSQRQAIIQSPLYPAILLLFLAGIFTKSAQFPFHFWLPGAMQAPAPVSAFLHSATMVKAGIFLLFRMSPALGGTDLWIITVTIFGAITMFSGAYLSITQTDLKGILAQTTISALGMLTMLIGINTKLSVKAALLFLVIHSLYKATLFMIAGTIDKKTGTRDISHLGGLARSMPIASMAAIIALLSMAGLPPMIGFIGKELIYEAKVQLNGTGNIVLILGILSNIGLVWVSGLFAYRVFFRKVQQGLRKSLEPSWSMLAGPVLLSALSLALGLAPGQFGKLIIEPALLASTAEILDVKLKLWHGFNTVFFLSLATVLTGFVLLLLSQKILPVLRSVNNRFFSHDLSGSFFRFFDGLMNFASKNTRLIQHGYHRYYLMVIFLFASGLIFYQLIQTAGWSMPQFSGDTPFYIIAVSIIVSAAAILTTFTGSRIAAVVLLGVTGYGIALIYQFYSGIDLAITQLLIETLTVILFMLVIWKLPQFKSLSTMKSRTRDLVIALMSGGVMTALTLKAVSVEFSPTISGYFTENSPVKAFGENVVNVILVDFRALDTLGEITVLTLAATGVIALLTFKSSR